MNGICEGEDVCFTRNLQNLQENELVSQQMLMLDLKQANIQHNCTYRVSQDGRFLRTFLKPPKFSSPNSWDFKYVAPTPMLLKGSWQAVGWTSRSLGFRLIWSQPVTVDCSASVVGEPHNRIKFGPFDFPVEAVGKDILP